MFNTHKLSYPEFNVQWKIQNSFFNKSFFQMKFNIQGETQYITEKLNINKKIQHKNVAVK